MYARSKSGIEAPGVVQHFFALLTQEAKAKSCSFWHPRCADSGRQRDIYGRPAEDAAQTKVGSGHGSAHREAGPRAAGTKHCEFRRPASLVAAEQAVSKKIPIIVTGGITDTGILTDYIIVNGILIDYIIATSIIIDLTTGIIIAARRSRRQPPLGWRVAKAGNLQDPAGGTCTRTSRHGPG